jgi:Flp pilus assembly protein TadG
MADTIGVKKSKFLSRLMRDEAGNAIAIMAAAIIPVIGLVGGGVDVSRMYLVKAKLQAACDAGSLMGRRVMGAGQWAENGGKANSEAEKLFEANFADGAYGAENVDVTYTESAGNVTGTASAVVPMALMQIFDQDDQTITANCDAELRTPSTDVMFVLDTTGSMNCEIDQVGCGNNGNVEATNAKIRGLRTAVRCFYEVLSKQNIAETSASDCGESADPTGGVSADVRLRFGFVPYAANVNVGKLLPLDYIADNWSYQSRVAVLEEPDEVEFTPIYGTESAPVQTGTHSSSTGNAGWSDVPVNENLAPPSGGYWAWKFNATRSSQCNVTLPPLIPGSSTGSLTLTSQNPNPVEHPDSLVTRTYSQTNGTYNTQHRYSYVSGGPYGRHCRLQRRKINNAITTIQYQTTQEVTWEGAQDFEKWEYRRTEFDISGLKDTTNNAWNQGVSLPLGDNGADKTVNWSGCIEERKTARINDNDPSDNWEPIPDDALDMDIDLIPDPSDPDTQWGPILDDVYYERLQYNTSDGWTTRSSTSESSTNDDYFYPSSNTYVGKSTPFCPTQAMPLGEITATGFSNYLDSLEAIGNTYHDIGLLWGARFMSQNGMFADVTNDKAGTLRHVVFMTDGATSASDRDVAPYGISGLDRRQNDGSSAPGKAWLESNINARTQALCRWLRTEGNTTVWVVSYGDLGAAANTQLRACADNNDDRFFIASNTPKLVSDFKKIAESISALRLVD